MHDRSSIAHPRLAQTSNMSIVWLMPDGRVKHVHAIAHAVHDSSGDREFVGAVTDITERKTAEDKIRRLIEAAFWESSWERRG